MLSASRNFGIDYVLLQDAGRLCLAALAILGVYLHHVGQAFTGALLPGLLLGAVFLFAFILSLVRQRCRTRALVKGILRDETDGHSRKLVEAAERAGLKSRIRLISSSQFHCFCFGLLRPEVCLSTAVINDLSPAELEAVLRHEGCHVNRRDPLRILFANSLASSILCARTWVERRRVEQELIADARTIREMGDKLPLASALLKAIQASRAPVIGAEAGAFGVLDARIEQLVKEQPEHQLDGSSYRRHIVFRAAEVAALFAFACLVMTASSAAGNAICLNC